MRLGQMEAGQFSLLSSLRGEFKSEDFIQPHYKESYRLAIDRLVSDGRDSYQEFLKGERVGSFLSEEELIFITSNAKHLPPQIHVEGLNGAQDGQSSSGTYWPIHSDVDAPDLDLGWPEVMHEKIQTNIDVLFHPPRQNGPTIKEVIRKHIQDARRVVAIAMDVFTDVDIFKEAVDASIRGVPVYVLLDDFNLKSFLTMAENQHVNIQQLRNMRLRTVKGQDYLCRSGTKFHGTMEQRFLLVDCQMVIYGSYSFTWSFEKINLSMVQVITGHLVRSYDEEFRTLYARSTVPADLCQPEGLFQPAGPRGRPALMKHTSPSAQIFDRREQLRNTLDNVYRKTCERKLGMTDLEYLEDKSNNFKPLIDNETNQTSQFQSAETLNFWKRHSYAGERQDGLIPQMIRPRASNWNICSDTGNVTNTYNQDPYLQVPQMHRGQNLRQSYNGNDKHFLSKQQNMPTLENTSKSFMRSWRIESYLKNPDVPSRDSSDYLDQLEPLDKASTFMQGRMRSSIVFRSTIPEQVEPSRHLNFTSSGANPSAVANPSLHYSSMQWNVTPAAENRTNNEEFLSKRQILDNPWNNTSYGAARSSYNPVYASLGRAKRRPIITNPDIMTDSWHKRHSVADPRSNTYYTHDSSGHMYGGFARMQLNRGTAGINAQNGGYVSNLNEDQRSVSHNDVKSPSSPIWQAPPSRTVSAATLNVNNTDLTVKSNKTGSHQFLKKSTKKIKSLLNIPEKREDSVGNTTHDTPTLVSSTDTLDAVDEEKIPDEHHQSINSSTGPTSQDQMVRVGHDSVKYSKPRFTTEERQHQRSVSPPSVNMERRAAAANKQMNLDSGRWSKDPGGENRLYNRFEPLYSFEKRGTPRASGNTQPSEKSKTFYKGDSNNGIRAARSNQENKLEKFIQRVGNLLHKSK